MDNSVRILDLNESKKFLDYDQINGITIEGTFRESVFQFLKNRFKKRDTYNFYINQLTNLMWAFVEDNCKVLVMMNNHEMLADDSNVFKFIRENGDILFEFPSLYNKKGILIKKPLIGFLCESRIKLKTVLERYWGTFLLFFIFIIKDKELTQVNEILNDTNFKENREINFNIIKFSNYFITSDIDGDTFSVMSVFHNKEKLKEIINFKANQIGLNVINSTQ